jgi:hypothetical protein
VAPPVNGLSGFVNAMEIAEGGTTRDALATSVSPRDSGMLALLPVGTIRSFRRTLKLETVQSVSSSRGFHCSLNLVQLRECAAPSHVHQLTGRQNPTAKLMMQEKLSSKHPSPPTTSRRDWLGRHPHLHHLPFSVDSPVLGIEDVQIDCTRCLVRL